MDQLCVLRCIKLALVHDMAECIVGDIAPSDNISKAEKHRREEAREHQHCHYTQRSLMCSIQNCVCVADDCRLYVFGIVCMSVITCVMSQEAMRHLSGLLPVQLKQEVYGLWEVSDEKSLGVSRTEQSCLTNLVSAGGSMTHAMWCNLYFFLNHKIE